jgi:beta-propeller repeat-containing protein
LFSRVNVILLAALLILSLASSAPRLQAAQQATLFQKTWGSTGDEAGTNIARDSNGNIYVTGAYNYGFQSPNHNSSDVLLLKYDSYGNLLWARSWGGSGEEVGFSDAVDSFGNILVAGWTASYGAGSYDALLLKFTPSGDLVWEKTIGSARFEQAWGVTLDSSGNILLTGMYNSTSGPRFLVLKLDSSGTLLWQKEWFGPESYGYSIAADTSGNIYASGFFINSTGHEAVLLKFSSSGSLLWQRGWGNQTAGGNHVALDSSGNVYMTGFYNPGSISNSFLVKFDSSGNLLWQRVYANGYGTGVAVDSSGIVYNSGWRYRTSLQTAADVFLLRFNSTGGLLTQNLWGGSGSSFSYGVAPDNSGHAIVAGFLNSSSPYAISPTTNTLSNPNIKADITSYGFNITTLSVTALIVAPVTPSGTETYNGRFDAFVFEYGDAAVSCGSGCTTSFQSNATIASASYDGTSNTILLTFTGTVGTEGEANVTIPKSTVLNQDARNIKVSVDQVALPSSALTIRMNATHFFVYFTFAFHSPVVVNISLGIVGVNLSPELAFTALLATAPLLIQMRKTRQSRH